MTTIRRLAAILAADVVGYSRMMGADEEGTLGRVKMLRTEFIEPEIAAHRGRVFKTMGDGLLAEFGSVVDAVKCAIAIQCGINERGGPMRLRIGLNVGDVIIDGGDIYGDGVNIAARIEPLSEAGGICVSARVQEDIVGKVEARFEDLGEQILKNIDRPVRIYRVHAEDRANGAGGDELRDWLALRDLTRYHPVFVESDVDLQTLRHLDEKDLEALNIPLGARRRLCAAIAEETARSKSLTNPSHSRFAATGVPIIGYIGVAPRSFLDEFKRGLITYGHIDGETIDIQYRWCGGDYSKYPDFLRELIDLPVDVIVAEASPAVTAAKQATRDIPIVIVGVGDPVGYGFVPSLMRPGGNITGMSSGLHEYAPRGLRLVKEMLPSAARIAILAPAYPAASASAANAAVKSLENTAYAVDLFPRTYTAGNADEIRAVLSSLRRESCDLLMPIPDQGLLVNRTIILERARELHIPVICPASEYVPDGGFMSLGPNFAEVHRRLGYYVDAILKGTPPSELPIEEPSKSMLLFNLKTARELGITIPRPILMRADQLIE